MMEQLKDKFNQTTLRSEKIKILTVAPKSWSQRKLANEFNAFRHTATVAKKLVEEKGVFSDPNPKKGNRLDEALVEKVKEFYLSEDISRMMPGKKDIVSVLVNGERQHIQKQLIMCNLKEAYSFFKDKYPTDKISFSKFAECRPKQCVLAGAAGTHSVCVCTTHQNMDLMFQHAKINKLTEDQDINLNTPQDFVAFLQCNPPTIECCLSKCDLCGNTEQLHFKLEEAFDQNLVDEISYKKWTSTDRANLETVVQNVEEFLTTFLRALKKYQQHAFITRMQSQHYRETKENLEEGEVLVVCDFAENYSFVIQDEIQAFHWNNVMATLHPFVANYKERGELKHINHVCISDRNIHDTVAVHLFLKVFLLKLKELLPTARKIIYFSDGCAGKF